MNRITRQFESLRAQGRKAFIPFVTAGDPDLHTTLDIVFKLADLGADVIELGVPFSDPMADGPVIQASSQRALSNGVRLGDVLELTKELRRSSDVPVVLFSYLNPLIRHGFPVFCKAASEAGVDGVLVTDAVGREMIPLRTELRAKGIEMISLVAPTTTNTRMLEIAGDAGGFIYAVSRAGVTGTQKNVSLAARSLVERVRDVTDLPVAVGFGISTRDHVEQVWQFADAAVVGSAIVDAVASSEPGDEVRAVERFVLGLLPAFANTQTHS